MFSPSFCIGAFRRSRAMIHRRQWRYFERKVLLANRAPDNAQSTDMKEREVRVGLISDTHGLLRTQVLDALRDSDFIIHAGDIGNGDVIGQLAEIAPVTAVRGNNDKGAWASGLREIEVLEVGEVVIYVIHDLAQLDVDPAAAGFRAVVSGHSHRPGISERDGVLYINPGSAGPRRFSLPVSLAHLVVSGISIRPQLVDLKVQGAA